MGHCFRASKGKKKFKKSHVHPVESGIAIRYTPESIIKEVVFGKNFGCIYYTKP